MVEKDIMVQIKGMHHRIKRVMQQNISDYNLTFGQLRLLLVINKYPDASQKELAEMMKFTQGAMSLAVKRLIELDMIKQVPLELDMRYNRLVVTDKGQSMIDNYEEELEEIDREMLKGFSDEELEVLSLFLGRINSNLDGMNKSNDEQNLEI
ncbi:MAG: MarR family winged helix-turn-helix transcriptional regulator [Tissierellaceae bacterium]|jgi:DNA-binding MarR family transcriptional regulator|nr:winged helix-turn-helix transcriptional regulator [Tissierellia bacterium]